MLLTWLTRGPRKQRTDPCNGLWMNSVVKQVLLDNPLSSTTPSFCLPDPQGGGGATWLNQRRAGMASGLAMSSLMQLVARIQVPMAHPKCPVAQQSPDSQLAETEGAP